MGSRLPFLAFALFAATFLPSAESLRILGLFPHPGLSHFHFFHPIMRGLADAGHDVTVISHFDDKNAPPNYKDVLLSKTDLLTNSVDLAMFENTPPFMHFIEFFFLHGWGVEACELAMNSTAIKNLLNTKQNFDVILMEQFNSDCMLPVAWKLKAPIIGLSSCVLMPWLYDRIGTPLISSYMPAEHMGLSDKMTYLERLSNWITVHGFKLLYKFINQPAIDKIVRKHIKDENLPYVGDLVYDTSMIFANTHFSYSGSKPFAPTVIELGGIHIKEAKPLDADLQKILDEATDGVIYVSWGSMVRADSLPIQKRESFLQAFGSLKQTVLWKWENETLPGQPKNVVIRKWMPQRDILCHPNVRVFITHGGLMGASEGAYCGVPMVLMPLYGDQFHNSAAAAARGIGTVLRFKDVNNETLTAAISHALKPTTRENAKKVSYSYKNRPMKAIETAIWWTEYVVATDGAPLLQSHSANMSAFEYYSFDVYLTILVTILIVTVLWISLLRTCLRRFKKDKSKTE